MNCGAIQCEEPASRATNPASIWAIWTSLLGSPFRIREFAMAAQQIATFELELFDQRASCKPHQDVEIPPEPRLQRWRDCRVMSIDNCGPSTE